MGQVSYPFFKDIARVGMLADAMPFEAITLINNSGRTKQVDTVTVDTGTHSHTYTLKIDGVTITYVADSATTTTEVAVGLTAAINAESLVNGRMLATSSTNVMVVTALNAGIGWTMSEVDALCTLVNTTANALSSTLAIGAAVVEDGTTDEKCKIASSANMTCKVVTCTPTHVNANRYGITVRVNGKGYGAEYLGDGSATVQEIVEALVAILNGLLPASTVVATEADVSVILTAEVGGLDFEVDCFNDLTGTWAQVDTTYTPQCNVNQAIRGISMFVENIEVASDNTVVYPVNSNVSVLKKGRIWVPTAAAVTPAKFVYMGHTSTAIGKFTGAATSNYMKLDPSKFRWVKGEGTEMGLLEVNL